MSTLITLHLTHATWVIQNMKLDKTNLIRHLLPWNVLFFHSQLYIQTGFFTKEMKSAPITESRFGSNWNQLDYIYIRRPGAEIQISFLLCCSILLIKCIDLIKSLPIYQFFQWNLLVEYINLMSRFSPNYWNNWEVHKG